MADVGIAEGRLDRDERGQLLLVAALGMAVLFVALALIMNTVIYTENLATRGSDASGAGDAAAYRQAAGEGTGGAIEYVNYHNNTSRTTLRRNLTEAIGVWSNLSARHAAASGQATNVSLVAIKNGTRIAQDNESRNFTDVSGAANWTLVGDVENTRKFRIRIPNPSADDSFTEPFRIEVDDGNNVWTMTVVDTDGDDIKVEVPDGDGNTETCSPSDGAAWINVTEGTVDGTDCEALSFAEGLSGDYSIRYENADEIEGTYQLVVDASVLPSPHYVTGGSPYVSSAIYSATVRITYQTARLRYVTNVSVAPGES